MGRKVNSYTIEALNIVVKLNDCVLIRSSNPDRHLHDVARVEELEIVNKLNVNVHITWYYWPDDLKKGRLGFHGDKELFLSDHKDVQSVHTIAGICNVHSFQVYESLENVKEEDFFYRFTYIATENRLINVPVEVFCKCELPCNPDLSMVQCDKCKDWFHPDCINMTIEDIRKLKDFLCPDCSRDRAPKRSVNLFVGAPARYAEIGAVVSATKAKVGSKRRKV